jgi:hypothetical protein
VKVKTSPLLFLSLGLIAAITFSVPRDDVIAKAAPIANINQAKFKQQILNGYCCVPNLSYGYRSIKLKNGEYKVKDETVGIHEIVIGQLDHKPVAVAFMSNWTGGSGDFDSLLLYEQRQGRAITVGSYGFGDRDYVHSISFRNGKIRLVTEKTLGDRPTPNQQTIWVKRSDFQKAECLQGELSKAVKEDVDTMVSLYIKAFSNQAFTPAEKKEGTEACNHHQKDRVFFAKAVRLTLEAGGYEPGPSPLQYDKDGNASINVDSKLRFNLVN